MQRNVRRPARDAHRLRDDGLDAELKSLLAGVEAGDRGSFRAFFDRTSQFVQGVALGILRNRAQAEDVVQEVYVSVWRRAGAFNPEQGRIVAWLARITRNKAIDAIRASRADRSVPLEVRGPGTEPHACDPLHDVSIIIPAIDDLVVRMALEDLRPEYRNALVLAFFRGHCHAEIAEILGVPLGTAKSWVRRGLMAMKDALE